MIEVVRLSAEDAIRYFDVVRHYLAEAVAPSQGEWSVSDYKEYLSKGLFDLWVILDKDTDMLIGAGVTEIVRHPQYNVCLIRLLNSSDGLNVIKTEAIEDWARQNKCKRLEMWGRKGWTRVLDKVGWEVSPYTIMNKEIADE